MMLEGGPKYLQVDPVMRARLQKEWDCPISRPLWALAVLVVAAIIYAIRWNRRLNA